LANLRMVGLEVQHNTQTEREVGGPGAREEVNRLPEKGGTQTKIVPLGEKGCVKPIDGVGSEYNQPPGGAKKKNDRGRISGKEQHRRLSWSMQCWLDTQTIQEGRGTRLKAHPFEGGFWGGGEIERSPRNLYFSQESTKTRQNKMGKATECWGENCAAAIKVSMLNGGGALCDTVGGRNKWVTQVREKTRTQLDKKETRAATGVTSKFCWRRSSGDFSVKTNGGKWATAPWIDIRPMGGHDESSYCVAFQRKRNKKMVNDQEERKT